MEDYGNILGHHGLTFKKDNLFLTVGDPRPAPGWILHLSVVASQFEKFLEAVLPLLIGENMPFKIARDKTTAQSILEGKLGYTRLGKVISIFPDDENRALSLARKLTTLTSTFKGPHILTDRHLGGRVYTRYGYFSAINGTPEIPYTIPFTLAPGLQWPFSSLAQANPPAANKVLNNKYRTMATLKEDARGNVHKALLLGQGWKIKWCLLKEGNPCMNADEQERDIVDRLIWQYQLQNELYESLPVPKAFELFKENDRTYLAMEYIKGTLLNEKIASVFKGRPWQMLPQRSRLKLLGYALQLIDIAEKMHRKGFIHRDITVANFIVTRGGRLTMIDLELVYSKTNRNPLPPFGSGTEGFMSPEQRESRTPTEKEDVYAVGASLIVLLTNLLPGKFSTTNPQLLIEQLRFFLGDHALLPVLAACFNDDPALRPDLSDLKKAVRQFVLVPGGAGASGAAGVPGRAANPIGHGEKKDLGETIDQALNALNTTIMKGSEDVWWSRTIQNKAFYYYQSQSASIYPGFHTGIAGVLYLLARAYRSGYPIRSCGASYTDGWKIIRTKYLQRLQSISGGLYHGTSGIAMALAEGIENGLIPDKQQALQDLGACLYNPRLKDLSLTSGFAGQGLALLRCAHLLDGQLVSERLRVMVDHLLRTQQPDGSWTDTDVATPGTAWTGLADSTAGITCFLLSYLIWQKNPPLEAATIRALQWISNRLTRDPRPLPERLLRPNGPHPPAGLENGPAGTALIFIKAFELFGEPAYRQTAETLLRKYPPFIVQQNVSLGNGLAGLGETCLEAARVFRSHEWSDRAEWIAQLLAHTGYRQPDDSCYWLTEADPLSHTADLFVGNAGIIHFLMRVHSPGALSHPILTI